MSGARVAPVTALLFDLGGTLDSDGISWKTRFFRLWREEVGEIAPERFDWAFYEADDALVGNLPENLPLAETVRKLAFGVATRLSAENGRSANRVASRFSEEASQKLAASARLLESLAPRYRLGIVSNFYGNLAAVCAEAGLAPWLAATIDSATVGAEKPDPRIFQAALSAVGAGPSEALLIGDSLPRDMEGARALGLRHVWVAGNSADALATACCPDDPVLRRLADLPKVLA